MSLADAQSADPEELQIFDTSLAMQLVVRAFGPNAPRQTEGSLRMSPSQHLGHTQQSYIQSCTSAIASQLRPRQ
jgi:hypothetical protein